MRHTRPNGLAAGAAVVLMGLAVSSSISIATAGTTPVNNVQPVIVDYGPTVNGQTVGFNNSLYTTVTVCLPGTTTCQSIDHVLVDTGSSGLRIISSVLAISFPYSVGANNSPIGNCVQYVDTTYQWGPVVKADVQMAGEVASSVSIQIVGASNFPAAPRTCSAGGIPAQTVYDLGANGILGVGVFRQDCGPACASPFSPPAVYFGCPTSGCTVASVPLSAQLQNPVWLFSQDNNGLTINLPQVADTGAVSVTGSMIFGIGTQSNNGLNGAQAQGASDVGYFTTTYNGVAYPNSYIDSGSSGYYFLNSTATGLPDCGSTSDAAGFYCPSSPVSLTAINTGPNPNGSNVPVSSTIAFSIANALPLIDSPSVAFNNLGGPNPGSFAWGLSFFFGRTVFIGIEGQSSVAGTGPYWAASTPDCAYQLSLSGQAFTVAGGTGSVAITAGPGCPWSVQNIPAGIALTSPASGTGSGAITFLVPPNNGGDLVNSLVVAGQTFTIEQEAASIPGLSFVGSMAHLAAEENWTTTLTLVNKSAASAQARLSFFGDAVDPTGDGPLTLPLEFPQQAAVSGPLLAASLDRTLAGNASLIVGTAGPQTPPVIVGSAQLAATGAVDGFAIFHLIPNAQEAVVPLETRNASSYLLAFDNTNGIAFGVALENVSAQAANIPVVIRDDTGAPVATDTISLAANGHYAFTLGVDRYPATLAMRGTIEFDTPSGGQIGVLGIRIPAALTFTTLPALAK